MAGFNHLKVLAGSFGPKDDNLQGHELGYTAVCGGIHRSF